MFPFEFLRVAILLWMTRIPQKHLRKGVCSTRIIQCILYSCKSSTRIISGSKEAQTHSLKLSKISNGWLITESSVLMIFRFYSKDSKTNSEFFLRTKGKHRVKRQILTRIHHEPVTSNNTNSFDIIKKLHTRSLYAWLLLLAM